jgi:hypothetical protein
VGDMREAWDDWKSHFKEVKEGYMPKRIAEILALRDAGHRVDVLVDGVQYRINGVLDLYPVHRRYHDIKSQKRGHYGKPENCVERVFGRGHRAAGAQHGTR